MTNYKLFDCQQMFRHACAFAECADMAMKKFRHDTADIEWYTEPATVNSAFACEVYLKALLLFHDVPLKKEHKIEKLFDMLPYDPKDYVKQTTMIYYGGMWKDAFGRELVESISDAFVDWRYSYETVGTKRASLQINIGFLTAFRNSLRELCCREFFNKTWDEYSAN